MRPPSGATFVRFQSPLPNRGGHDSGIFALVNGLAFDGRLDDAQERYRRTNNGWFNDHLTDPADVLPGVYDRDTNPRATSWFRASATEMLDSIPGYLDVLRAHGVECETVWSGEPGEVVYEDDYQVVVIQTSLA